MKTAGISKDIFVSILLTCMTVLFAYRYVNFSILPFEDAAILMRYASHFSKGYGIVWNIGEAPVDGATDFLFLIVTGLTTSAGIPMERAVRSIGFIAHILTVVLVYLTLRRIYASDVYSAALSALYLAVSPGLYLIAAYFGTPFFTLSVCATWVIAIAIMISKASSHVKAILFSIFSLTMGLIRPEGVFMAGFMLLSIICFLGVKESKHVILWFLIIYALLGGAYFFWRWDYFGYPLPNPFYKKGGGILYLDSFRGSVENTIRLCLPFLLPFVMGIRTRKTLKMTLCSLIPIIGFMSIWILLSKEMNFGGRFQYPILPVVLLSWYPLVKNIRTDLNLPKLSMFDVRTKVSIIAVFALIFVGILYYQMRRSGMITYPRDGRYEVAVMLNEYKGKEYTIATTEAGLLPLYSQWRAIDTWGLNDQWITHNKGITEEYLKRNNPQIIMWHEDLLPGSPPSNERDRAWFKMIGIMKDYIERNNYELAAAFGESPYKTHNYYVSKDFPDSKEIMKRIRTMDYPWYRSGRRSINYALFRQYRE